MSTAEQRRGVEQSDQASAEGLATPARGAPPAPKRLFLVGCARSGTTVLQAALARHPDVLSFPETQFFKNLCGRIFRLQFGRRRPGPKGALIELAGDLRLAWRFTAPNVDRVVQRSLRQIGREEDLRRFPLKSRRVRRIVEPFIETLDAMAREQGAAAWLEKSPDHVLYADVIEECVPGAIFIHNLRHPEENIASLWDVCRRFPDHHWGKYYRTPEDCVIGWVRAVKATLRVAHAPNHVIVHHHQFLERPESTLRRLCEHCGLPFDPVMTGEDGGPGRPLFGEDEPWKQEASSTIRRRASNKFAAIFTSDEQRRVRAMLAEYGFDQWPVKPPRGVLVA